MNIKLIQNTKQKKNEIINKFGKEWYEKNIIELLKDKMMYSYSFLFKKEREMRERKVKVKNALLDKDDNINYTSSKIQIGGNQDIESEEFDLDELENMHKESDVIDDKINETNKLINNILDKEKNKKKILNSIKNFPNDKDNLMYDDNLKNLYKKIYIDSQYIYNDDTIIKIKEKICCSVKLNNLFVTSGNTKHEPYILPSRIYLWSEYSFRSKR